MTDERRLVKDYLPIQAISAAALWIQNPTVKLDHAKREVVVSRFFETPAEAIMAVRDSR